MNIRLCFALHLCLLLLICVPSRFTADSSILGNNMPWTNRDMTSVSSITATTGTFTTGSAGKFTIQTLTLGTLMTDAQQSAIQTAIGLIIGQGPSESGDVMQWDPDLSEFVGMTAKPATTNILFFDPSGLFQTNLSDGRGVLGLSIGINVQAYNALLAQIAGSVGTANSFLVGTGSVFEEKTPSQARTSLGVGTISTMANDNVLIEGGSVNGTAIGNTSESSGKFSNLTAVSSFQVSGIMTVAASLVEVDNFTATGTTTVTLADINGGNIDGTVIGASSPSNGTFGQLNSTNISTTQTVSSADLVLTGDITAMVDGTASGTFSITTASITRANITTINGSVTVVTNVTASAFYGDGSNLTGISIGTVMQDADTDTKIQVEESADEDFIRFDTGGSQAMVITATGSVGIGDPTPQEALTVVGNIEATGTTSGTTISATTLITGPSASITSISGTTLNVTDVNYSGSISGDGTGMGGVVHTATDETVNGVKTFGSIPILPASNPTSDNQAVRKAFLGSIATQDVDGVALTGGTLDGIAIGQTSASNAIFGIATATTANITTVNATTVNGTLGTAAQPNITSIGTASRLTATNFDGTNFNGTNLTGTIQTAAQPNITSIGSASRLTATNFDGTNGNFTNVAGTLTTATQANVTDIGTQTSADINGGFIDGTPIGQTSASNAKFGAVTMTSSYNSGSSTLLGSLDVGAVSYSKHSGINEDMVWVVNSLGPYIGGAVDVLTGSEGARGYFGGNAEVREPYFIDADGGVYMSLGGYRSSNASILKTDPGVERAFFARLWRSTQTNYGFNVEDSVGGVALSVSPYISTLNTQAFIVSSGATFGGNISVSGVATFGGDISTTDAVDSVRLTLSSTGSNAIINLNSDTNTDNNQWSITVSDTSTDYLRIATGTGEFNGHTFLYNALAVGSSDPGTYALHVTGEGFATGGFSSPSDSRYKNRIATIPNALSKVLRINGVHYEWSATTPYPALRGKRGTGFIAQEVQEVLPDAIKGSLSEMLSVDVAPVVGLLIEALKEEHKRALSAEKSLRKSIKENLGLAMRSESRFEAMIKNLSARVRAMEQEE